MVSKRLSALLLALLLTLGCCSALAAVSSVIDDANLYTLEEEAQLQLLIDQVRDQYQMDAVVLTTYDVPQSYGDDSVTVSWADAYYENHGYGLGEDRAGVLFIVDMTNRYNYISTAGVMIDYLSDRRIENILDEGATYLSSGRYGSAMTAQLRQLLAYLRNGIEEGSFRYDEVTGQRLTGLYNKLTQAELVVALVAGLAVAVLFYGGISSVYHQSAGTYAYKGKSTQNIVKDEKELVKRTRHTSRIPTGGGGGGGRSGGFGGGGGGSGVHTSSGGMSHGGGGRHF